MLNLAEKIDDTHEAGENFTRVIQIFFFKKRKNPGEGNGTPLQYSCLENPMDGGAW